MGEQTSDFKSKISDLAAKIVAKGAKTNEINRLSGGASQETWMLTIDGQKFVLRRSPGGASHDEDSYALSLETEAQLLLCLNARNATTPHIVYALTPDDGLGPGFVMKFISGETIPQKLLKAPEFEFARTQLAAQAGEALAKIHATPISELPEIPRLGGYDQVVRYEDIYRQHAPRPVFELAIRWLKDNSPSEIAPSLVHGDFRNGNLMVDESGLKSVLDWELAHIGDPREDIGWICVNSWRFGRRHNRVGGFGQLDEFMKAYTHAGGASFSSDDILYWEMLGTLKWGIMCLTMYNTMATGKDPSIERAMIGRRASETEMDLINLFEEIGA